MIAGNPITEDYVKSYKISYSIDCYNYYDVLSVGGSDVRKIFREYINNI